MSAPRAERPGVRQRSAAATREAILRAAIKVFATHGYAGGRVEQISRSAKSHDRMIYYYFGSKEGLYIAVLEEMYRRFNVAESALALDELPPVGALLAVVRFMLEHYRRHPEFITLLNTENLHRGRHIAKSARAHDYSSPAVGVLGRVLARGVAAGDFRAGVASRDIYLMVASMAYFYLSNRYTLSAFLGEKLDTPAALAHWESFLGDAVLRTLAPGPADPRAPAVPSRPEKRKPPARHR